MNRFIYIHGTNGSGKSTLARALIAACGGVQQVDVGYGGHPKASTTLTTEGVVLVGKYGNACGGVDGLSPYAAIHDVCLRHAIFPEARLLAEGLVTPGLETCQKLAGYFGEAMFIYLDTPEEQCIRNVLRRRARKGTTKEYDPTNLRKKTASAVSWANRLEQAGLNVQRLNWRMAYLECLDYLGIEPHLNHILGVNP